MNVYGSIAELNINLSTQENIHTIEQIKTSIHFLFYITPK